MSLPQTGKEQPSHGYSRENLRGDLAGGAAAAAVTVPVSIVLGIVTLEHLGPQAPALGVTAGVLGTILCSILVVVFGSRSTAINVPRSVTAIFVAGLMLQAALTHKAATHAAPSVEFLYAATFLFLALTSAFQALIGMFRLGSLVKYLPHAVLGGFMNAVAVLLILAQGAALFGMPSGASLAEVVVRPDLIRPAALVVAALSLIALLAAQRHRSRVPPLLAALFTGTLAHHLIAGAGFSDALGPTLGSIQLAVPRFDTFASFPRFVDGIIFVDVLPGIAGGALGLALITSLDFLLYQKAFENFTRNRVDSQRELARLGIANTVAACLGALPCGMTLGASQANNEAGGRSYRSLLFHAGAALLAVVALSPFLSLVPRAVLAAMLVSIAINVIDRPTLSTLKKLVLGRVSNRQSLAVDALEMLAVASIAILLSVAVAVAAGIAIAIMSFLVNMSHSVIRRVYRGDAVHSRRSRGVDQAELLARHGKRILVIELEGVVFFGTADDLMSRIDGFLKEDLSHIILDLRRVTEVDTTGARMLAQIGEYMHRDGRKLIISHVIEGDPMWDLLVDTGAMQRLGIDGFTADTDHALELAEDELIAAELGSGGPAEEIRLRDLKAFELLTDSELETLSSKLERREFSSGELVFREGDLSSELYVIAKGAASVSLDDGARSHRLVTFSEGTVFGEMALLDHRPRSASVRADESLVCYSMRREDFERLVTSNQDIAVKLLSGMSQELGRRLRLANETINHLQW